jgi:16S rRNA (uracil1498-N3)-methyltransferase
MGDNGDAEDNLSRPARFALRRPIIEGIAILDGAELHHARDVMRLRAGATIALMTEDNAEHLARIERFEDDRAIVRIQKTAPAAEAPALILATAIIKGPRMDFLVEKAAELGVTELWPVLCERSVVRAPGGERIGRWRRLATAAAKQSFAPGALELHDPIEFGEMIEALSAGTSGPTTLKILCTMGAEPVASVVQRTKPTAVVIACGPEGDFTDDEIEAAKRAGFVPASLGNNRLRSETAAIAAVSIVAALLDEFRTGE